MDLAAEIKKYKSYIEQWDEGSLVRARPRRLLCDEKMGDKKLYPEERQTLCLHPHIIALGDKAKRYILVQSLYKYLNDIANIEKDLVNKVCYKINKNDYFLKFTKPFQQDALSIIIDESYHAYVALDFMNQVEEATNISSIDLPSNTELSDVIEVIKSTLPNYMYDNFELIAICIAEHALTNDLIAISKAKDVSRTFYLIMHDHVLDEGRHANYFSNLLKIFWYALPEKEKLAIGKILPLLITRYIASDIQKDFDLKIMNNLSGLSKVSINQVMQDTYQEDPLKITGNVVFKQMMALLKNTGVLNHKNTYDCFRSKELVN